MNYKHLLSTGTIGDVEIKNRILLSAMGSMYAEEDGSCGEHLWDYYEARARGGTGMLILETSAVGWPNGTTMPRMVGFSNDDYLPGLRTLCQRVQQHGARIAAQLNHGGKVSTEDIAHGRPVMVPSIPGAKTGDLFAALTQSEIANFISAAGPDGKGPRYHPMTKQDIDDVVQLFASAAARAREAGFDAIEIHGGHGYLISSFLSPDVNKRTDEYGGSAENRARLLLEIISAVRSVVGNGFPIMLRIDGHEYRIDGGITIDDAVQTAKLAEQAGADAIDVSAYGNSLSGIAFTEAPLVHEPGGLLQFAHAVKKAVRIPVIGVGRIEPEVADREIGSSKIDFVAMGRKLLADAELPNKLAADKARSVRPCIYCYVCVSKIFMTSPIVCAVNPGTGREKSHDTFAWADPQKKIAVVGGGPAGMEAARVLALRGHSVTLWERERDLGGTARIAALPYEPNGKLVRWLTDAIRELPIDIRTGTAATPEQLAATKPDHVIVATGASRAAPEIPGKELDHVFDGDRLRDLLLGGSADAARGLSLLQRLMVAAGRLSGITRSTNLLRRMSKLYMPLGKRIVLIGGGLVGLELAEYLVERGRKVTVLEPSPSLGAELAIVRRARVLHMLRKDGVNMLTGVNVDRIDSDGVAYTTDDGATSAEADNVIISTGAQPDNKFADSLAGHEFEVHVVGDCAEVGYIEGAMLSARRLAVTL